MILCATAICGAPLNCLAQDQPPTGADKDAPVDLHKYTFNVGYGAAFVGGPDGKNNLKTGRNLFEVSVGRIIYSPGVKYDHGIALPVRWHFLANLNFMTDRSDLKQGVLQQAVIDNPQNTTLLAATSGKATFYAVTLDPTVRFLAADRFSVYGFAGFGWFQRSLDLGGASIQGPLLQTTSPTVLGPSGSSGVFEAGGGADVVVARRWASMKVYFEARVLKGLAINSGSTLFPLSAGVRW